MLPSLHFQPHTLTLVPVRNSSWWYLQATITAMITPVGFLPTPFSKLYFNISSVELCQHPEVFKTDIILALSLPTCVTLDQ